MRRPNVSWLGVIVLLALVAGLPVGAFAQAAQSGTAVKADAVAGKYQGNATTPDGDMAIKVDLKVEKGSLTGTIDSPHGPMPITNGTIEGDKVTLTADAGGSPATMTGTIKGDRIEGTWSMATGNGTFSLTKVTEDAAKTPADKPAAGGKPAANAADPLSGQWEGVTGNNDMSVPFTMNLKLEGEKVTGDISSDQGGAAFNPGTWKDGTLNISFEFSGMGTVTMAATFKEGKLVGTMDFGGQMQMSWAAVKKGA